jgi:hypothetical protein
MNFGSNIEGLGGPLLTIFCPSFRTQCWDVVLLSARIRSRLREHELF